MKRGGGIAIAAAFTWFLLSGISSPIQNARQGSETETETPTASDLFIPASVGSETATPTGTEMASPTGTDPSSSSNTATPTGTETGTYENTGTATLSPGCTDTPSPTIEWTLTDTPTLTPTATAANSPTTDSPPWVIISEVAWAGTRASANDEWIEL